MAQVAVTINGRTYQIACDDGQEDHLRELAAYVNKRVEELVETLGQVGDARLLVMASLLVADELAEAFSTLEEREQGAGAADPGAERARETAEAALAAAIESLAQRVEDVAARLEAP